MDYDLILRGGIIVTPDRVEAGDIAIGDERIEAVGKSLRGSGREEIDARELHVFPGWIDAHVHFNEPGRTDWEGFETGSRSLAAGGGTLFFDMPLNSIPPTINAAAFDRKLAAANGNSLVDFCLWGGLVPGNLGQLEALHECGVIGFKAFMVDSGVSEFSAVGHKELREGMKIAAKLGAIVAVHAEWPAKITHPPIDKKTVRDFIQSRPIAAEHEAIRIATEIAGETGCALHVVHVSAGSSVELVTQARKQGVNVSCETCPHYLLLTDKDMEKLGAVAKCAPPLRPDSEQDSLWEQLQKDAVNFVASDHSPSPWSLKNKGDFFQAWGGISSCQHAFSLFLSEAHHRNGFALEKIAALTSAHIADRYGLVPMKGQIAAGADADLTLVRLDEKFKVTTDSLLYRHKHTPYVGREIRGRVLRTIIRGRTVFRDGKIISQPVGRLVKPTRNSP